MRGQACPGYTAGIPPALGCAPGLVQARGEGPASGTAGTALLTPFQESAHFFGKPLTRQASFSALRLFAVFLPWGSEY